MKSLGGPQLYLVLLCLSGIFVLFLQIFLVCIESRNSHFFPTCLKLPVVSYTCADFQKRMTCGKLCNLTICFIDPFFKMIELLCFIAVHRDSKKGLFFVVNVRFPIKFLIRGE
jgi:hypothetical protein